MFCFKRVEIANCDGDRYMTRWILFRGRRGHRLMLHLFHRGDDDRERHDHPWWFISLILWRGYYEVTAQGVRRYYPGQILFRPARWAHRVNLAGGKAVTLVLTGPRTRSWGFWMDSGEWLHHSLFSRAKGCV